MYTKYFSTNHFSLSVSLETISLRKSLFQMHRNTQALSAIPIYSINYDFVPTIPNGYKCLFVELRFPPPPDLRIGEGVILHSDNPKFVPPPGKLNVLDIIGTRVVLTSDLPRLPTDNPLTLYKPKNDRKGWRPIEHGYHWGYVTRDVDSLPSSHLNGMAGNGGAVGWLVW